MKEKRVQRSLVILMVCLIVLFSSGIIMAKTDYSGSGEDVMLQGFHWNSWQYGTWNIIRDKADEIKEAGFTMVWFPPVSRAADNVGYLPNEWYTLHSNHGSEAELREAVYALNERGVKPIADIVINHRVGSNNWADFAYPHFYNNQDAVVCNDEWGAGEGNYDTGEGYGAGRDLDHTYLDVQDEVKYWLSWLKNDIGFKGWRYDYVKGYAGRFTGLYNSSSQPYFSVGEFWADITGDYYASGNEVNYHRQKLMDWINATGNRSTAFDFTTKWQLMLAVSRSEYWRLKDPNGNPIGAIGWWPKMSVTFLDNHDTGASPNGGQKEWPFPSDKIEQGYAYILTHPGTPCVYWPHYFDWGTDLRTKIKKLIKLRQEQNITSTSKVEIKVAASGKYAAVINNNLAVKIGGADWQPGYGWQLRTSGNQWAVWTR